MEYLIIQIFLKIYHGVYSMKLTKLFSIFALMIALGFGLNSCEEDATSVEPVVIAKLAAPTDLMATSNNETSVILKWTPSVDQGDANFKGYEITVDGAVQSTGTTGIKNPITIPGLSAGEHTFTVRTLSADTSKKAHSVVTANTTIKWAPAWRFTNEQKIRFYSSANTTNGSGLVLFDEDEKFPYNLTVKDLNLWTLGISDKTEGILKFGPAKALDYTNGTGKELKNVVISKAYFAADSLNEMFDSKALDTKEYLGSAESFNLSTITTTKAGVVFLVKEKTEKGTIYAKIFLKKGDNGFFNGTDAKTKYIVGEVSYQKTHDLPYAKTK